MGNRLFVGGLPWAADERELTEAFSAIGSVVDVKIIRDPETGRSRGFGFVALSTPEESANAIRQMDGALIGGRRVTVREAQDRAGPGPSRPGPDRGDRPPRPPMGDRPPGGDRPPYAARDGSMDPRPPRPPMDRGGPDRSYADRGGPPRPPMDRPPRPDGPGGYGDRQGGYGDRQGGYGDRPAGYGDRPAGYGDRQGGPRGPDRGWGGPRPAPPMMPPPSSWSGQEGSDGWSRDREPQRKTVEQRPPGPDRNKKGRRFDDWGAGRLAEKPRQRREKGRQLETEDWSDDDDE